MSDTMWVIALVAGALGCALVSVVLMRRLEAVPVVEAIPKVMPREPDQPYVLGSVTTAMNQHDWSGGPPYREITCPCGWKSRLAERVLDGLGQEMRTKQHSEARAHYHTCEQAHSQPERTPNRYLCKCGYTTDYVEEYGDHRAKEMDDVAHYNVLNKDPDYNKNPIVISQGGQSK